MPWGEGVYPKEQKNSIGSRKCRISLENVTGLDIRSGSGYGRVSPSQESGDDPPHPRPRSHCTVSLRVLDRWLAPFENRISGSASGVINCEREVVASRLLGWDEAPAHSRMPKPDLATAERVETLGRKIIAQNTFTGIEPLFHTIGVQEPVLFHEGPERLMISEGLVKQCRTDGELAAVLCSELARMVADKQSARRVGAERDSFPEIGVPTSSGLAGGSPDDPARAAERAYPRQAAQEGDEPRIDRPQPDCDDLMPRRRLRPRRPGSGGAAPQAIRSRAGHQEATRWLRLAPRWEW